jgi:helicase required for RNAi-mediated heterochromatin assembly 1
MSALQPKALLIEEAAETLEGYVVAGMVDSLEHLVLVEDHKQLQVNCTMGYLSRFLSSRSASLWHFQCSSIA